MKVSLVTSGIIIDYSLLDTDIGIGSDINIIAAVRVGYLMDVEDAKDDKDTPDIDESTMLENIFAGPSFGATLNLLKLTGLDLSIDYAMFMTEYFDDNHVITLRFGR